MLKAVIFDFDGVITDSEILHLRAFNKVLARFGVEIKKKDYYSKYLGYTDLDCYKHLIEDGLLKIDKNRIPELVEQKDVEVYLALILSQLSHDEWVALTAQGGLLTAAKAIQLALT